MSGPSRLREELSQASAYRNNLIPTVFHNRWWLEAASGGTYQEVDVRSGGKVVARLPYVEQSRYGFHRLCLMPELTHFLGPAIDCEHGSPANRSLRQFQLTQQLLEQVQAFSGFHQCMHRGVEETVAFEAAGYVTKVQFTYEIGPRSIEDIWGAMRDKTRNVIRRAQERWEVSVIDDPFSLQDTYQANLRTRGLVNAYSRIPFVCAAALSQGRGRILAVRKGHNILGAIFVVWDESVMYYLLSTRAPEADNGVISLLIWDALRLANQLRLTFDFDGMGQLGSRLLFTGFSGQAKPRFLVQKSSASLRTCNLIAKAFRGWR